MTDEPKEIEKVETQGDATSASAEETVKSIKGFNHDLTCRDFKFEIGKTYTMDAPIVACERGFHAIEGHPLEVFNYYPPATSRYCETTQSGSLARHSGDSKLASAKITIGVEISISELTARAVKWVFDRAKWTDGPVATGNNEAATASGTQGAATASGTQGAATASGDQGAATASGYQGAATASGYQGAATASGEFSVAISSGLEGKARGEIGTAICLVNRNEGTGKIIAVRATKIGENGTAPGIWYRLSSDGEFVEA